MRLSHADFDALQHAILELYEYRDLESFHRVLPGIFLKIISADYFAAVDGKVDPASGKWKAASFWESEPRINANILGAMERTAVDHPFTQYSFEKQDPTALKISDFLTLSKFRSSRLYMELYRDLQAERFLAIAASPGRGTMTTLNVTRWRSSKDFSERDRLILNLLRPHYDQARHNAELASAPRFKETRPLADYHFTPREMEIANWLSAGKMNPEIAIIIRASRRTVEKHVEKILEKMGVENRTTAAVVIAQSRRIS